MDQPTPGGQHSLAGQMPEGAAAECAGPGETLQQLQQSQARLRDLIETTSDMVWEVDARGVYTYVSPRVRDLLGYEPDEVLGRTPFDLMPPEEARRVRRIFESIAAQRQPFHLLENVNRRKDGRMVVLESSGMPFFDEKGALAGYRGVDRDITERKRVEEELRATGERLRIYARVVEHSPDLIVVFDREYRLRLVNPAYIAFRGRPPEEVIGHKAAEMLGEQVFQERVRPQLDRALAGATVQFGAWFTSPTLGQRFLEVAYYPLRVDSTVEYVVAVMRDQTERERVRAERERLLAEVDAQRQRFQTVIESASVAIAVLRVPDLTFEIINPAAHAYLPGTEAVGRPLAQVSPAIAPLLRPMVDQVLATGEPYRSVDTPLMVRRTAGGPLEEAYFTLTLVPLRAADGHIDSILGMAIETTEQVRARRRIEELAREAEQRAMLLDATINAMADGLIITDSAGRVTRANAAAARILGVAPGALQSTAEGWELLRPETPDGRPVPYKEAPDQRALRGETLHGQVLAFHPRPDRTVWTSGSAAPIRGPDGHIVGAILTFADITPLHELQEQREDMLRAVSHDLRNPLAAVMGHAQLLLRLLEEAGLTGREAQSARAIITGCERMNTMIQDLVDAARSEARQLQLQLSPVDLPSFIAHLLQRQAEVMETARIRIEPGAVPPVLADPSRLERILLNLLSNALRYSTPGTEVTVRFGQRDGEVITSVIDRGPGIAPEELPKLFQRYYRPAAAPTRREGVGLGLYITRVLVEAHGGRIWAESTPGEGSVFSFSLPLAGKR